MNVFSCILGITDYLSSFMVVVLALNIVHLRILTLHTDTAYNLQNKFFFWFFFILISFSHTATPPPSAQVPQQTTKLH